MELIRCIDYHQIHFRIIQYLVKIRREDDLRIGFLTLPPKPMYATTNILNLRSYIQIFVIQRFPSYNVKP